MSTTLTNGLKLPDKGSVDWYADMQSNYTILDGAVGTVAEHTTQIAGKASASHTHGNITNDGKVGTTANLPLITGTGGAITTGSFGNSANTFCEGNDSRLSDARTPVAHTHTKSDVTDLFNSANTWSENNTFSSYITLKESAAIPASGFGKGIAFRDYQNNRLGYIQPYLTSNSEKRLVIGADSGDVASNSNLIPNANNSVNLGSSSYQWNNLYAKNYYYNGTEFQNKFVTLDTSQTISGLKYFSSIILHKTPQTIDVSTNPAEVITGTGLQFVDNTQYWGDITPQWTTDGTFRIRIAMTNYNTSGTSTGWFCPLVLDLAKDGSKIDVWSTHPNTNLGTATAKWKTLNGVNPGALSLPSGGTTENTDWFNVAGDILPTGGNATSFNKATANYFTPAKDGWLALAVKNCSELSVWCETLKYGISIVAPDASLNRQVVIPVVAGKSYQILIAGNSWTSARLIMPKGNV